jgi:hypothetical protein
MGNGYRKKIIRREIYDKDKGLDESDKLQWKCYAATDIMP